MSDLLELLREVKSELGKQPFRGQTWLCGKWDEAAMLSEIVGWAVDSESAQECAEGVTTLKREGFISTRRHKAPIGDWDAYCLTLAGFERLRQIGYGSMYDDAIRAHRFYERNAAALSPSREDEGK